MNNKVFSEWLNFQLAPEVKTLGTIQRRGHIKIRNSVNVFMCSHVLPIPYLLHNFVLG